MLETLSWLIILKITIFHQKERKDPIITNYRPYTYYLPHLIALGKQW